MNIGVLHAKTIQYISIFVCFVVNESDSMSRMSKNWDGNHLVSVAKNAICTCLWISYNNKKLSQLSNPETGTGGETKRQGIFHCNICHCFPSLDTHLTHFNITCNVNEPANWKPNVWPKEHRFATVNLLFKKISSPDHRALEASSKSMIQLLCHRHPKKHWRIITSLFSIDIIVVT